MSTPVDEIRLVPKHLWNARGEAALSAMYVIAAVGMFVGFLVIVALMFVPSDWRSMFEDREVYVPGAMEGYTLRSRPAVLGERPGVSEVAPGKFRVVLVAYNWEFVPNEIRLPAGAEVEFVARSGQDYHGLAIIGTPIVMSLLQNEIAEAHHTFTEPGEYLFVCSEYCGAGHATMAGKIIVE